MKDLKEIWPFNANNAEVVDGTECVIRYGHLCGYTAFPLASLPESWHGNCDADALQFLDVHGGITYAEVEDGWCVFGFDCAHSGDSERAELQDPAHVMKLAKRMREQLETFAARVAEWRESDRETRIKIIEEIRGDNAGEMGFGALISCLAGGKEFGEDATDLN